MVKNVMLTGTRQSDCNVLHMFFISWKHNLYFLTLIRFYSRQRVEFQLLELTLVWNI